MDDVKEKLQCIICHELPRPKELPLCFNGHITCQDCAQKTPNGCAVCTEELTANSSIIRQLLYIVLVGVTFKCRFFKYGCGRRETIEIIEQHETNCQFREIKCPSPICPFISCLTGVVMHEQEGNCMAIKMPASKNLYDQLFHGTICLMTDFQGHPTNVQQRVKHVLLMAKVSLAVFMYLTIVEDEATKLYHFTFRCGRMPKTKGTQCLQVKLELFHPDESFQNSPRLSFVGQPNRDDDDLCGIRTGNLLLLHESQINNITSPEKLLGYEILIQELN